MRFYCEIYRRGDDKPEHFLLTTKARALQQAQFRARQYGKASVFAHRPGSTGRLVTRYWMDGGALQWLDF